MIVNFAIQSLVWAAFVLIAVAIEDAVLEPGGTTPSMSTKATQTHSVTVGKGGMNQFAPNMILAEIGDIIQFDFFPPNHSVARAEAGNPCYPYEYTDRDKIGFFSGFRYLAEIPKKPSIYNLVVNDTDPVFFYCSAPKSCIDYAMVGVINPNDSHSLVKQQDAARKSLRMVSPGEPLPRNEDGSSPSLPPPSAGHGKKLSSGAIAGITVGSVVGAGLIGAMVFVLGRKSGTLSRRRKESMTNLPSGSRNGSGPPRPYSLKPMSDYEPYTPWSPYGLPMPQSPPVELSSPQPDLNKHTSAVSGETAYDDFRWQTITPIPPQPTAMRLELDASPAPQGSMVRDIQEGQRQ